MSEFDPIKYEEKSLTILKILTWILVVAVITLISHIIYDKTGANEIVTEVPRVVTVKEISKDIDYGDMITFVDKTDGYKYKVSYTEEHVGLAVGKEYDTICTIKVKHYRDGSTHSKRSYKFNSNKEDK